MVSLVPVLRCGRCPGDLHVTGPIHRLHAHCMLPCVIPVLLKPTYRVQDTTKRPICNKPMLKQTFDHHTKQHNAINVIAISHSFILSDPFHPALQPIQARADPSTPSVPIPSCIYPYRQHLHAPAFPMRLNVRLQNSRPVAFEPKQKKKRMQPKMPTMYAIQRQKETER